MDRSQRKATSMNFELFTDLVDQIARWKQKPRLLYLNTFGEPLLDETFTAKIKYLAKKGLAEITAVLTNAQFLSREISETLCAAAIQTLRPALDSHRRDAFETIRKGCSFDTVRDNIIQFAAIRNAMNSSVKIQIQHIRTTYNLEDAPGLYKLLAPHMRLGDELFVGSGHSCASRELAQAAHIIHKPEAVRQHSRCPHIEQNMVVLADGIVAACCVDYNLRVPNQMLSNKGLGDARTTPIIDIWNGEPRINLKNAISSGDNTKLPNFCRGCMSLYGYFSKQIGNLPKEVLSRTTMGGSMPLFQNAS